jgi:hypothetical protein
LSDGGAERNEAVVVWALQRRWLGLRQINWAGCARAERVRWRWRSRRRWWN